MLAVVVVGRSRDRVLNARAYVSELARGALFGPLFTCAGKNLELNGAGGLAPQSGSGDEEGRARTNPRPAAATHDVARDTAPESQLRSGQHTQDTLASPQNNSLQTRLRLLQEDTLPPSDIFLTNKHLVHLLLTPNSTTNPALTSPLPRHLTT
jgi:hypothetical protein